jgi:type IV pilus assembly protein PilY1
VAGGVLADLGAASLSSPAPLTATRRFYNMPDVVLVQRRGKATYFHVGIGSGYRGHPLDQNVQDRFYALRDYDPFTKLTQAQYNARTAITDGTMVDVTTDLTPTVADGSPGWKLELRDGVNWLGEKVLAQSQTFNNVIFFPTYLPNTGSSVLCSPAAGSNRVYVVSLFDGAPVIEQDGVFTDTDNDGVPDAGSALSAGDRYGDLRQGGIAPEVAFLFPSKDVVVCLSGVEVLGACKNFNSRVKTYWRETGAN